MMITQILPLEHSKGKVQVSFDSAQDLVLYRGELRGLDLKEQMEVSKELYDKIYYEIVGKRAVKRAMHLLEKMDRTEEQLRKKLEESRYPQELVDQAVAYVKSYHYIDDERYACNFVRLNQEKKSAARIKMDLLAKGIAPETAERALEAENETPPEVLIKRLLEKKKFDPAAAAPKETAKMYQFLLRRGFHGNEIMRVLKDRSFTDADD